MEEEGKSGTALYNTVVCCGEPMQPIERYIEEGCISRTFKCVNCGWEETREVSV